jgi:hypothetical protein
MKTDGIIAIVLQPQKPSSATYDVVEAENKISPLLKEAGFKNITVRNKNMKSEITICFIGSV